MVNYEAMFILKTGLSEDVKKTLFNQISEGISKNSGKVASANIWAERRLVYPIKKCQDGVYYLVNFSAPAEAIVKINQAYKLSENILRVLITRLEK